MEEEIRASERMAVDEIASGVMAKVITCPAGFASRSLRLIVTRGQSALGTAPGPFDCHSASSARTATAKCARSSSPSQRCQVSMRAKASVPQRNTSGRSGPCSRRYSPSVSTV